MILQISILAALLLLSAFFSGSETAFFSLNQFEKEKLSGNSHGRRKRFVRRILSSPAEILITILTGNMVVNLSFASLMDGVVEQLVVDNAWLYSILFGTLLVLIFGEMTPKNLAIRHSLPFFLFASPILRVMHAVLTPFRYVLRRIESAVVTLVSRNLSAGKEDGRSLISSTFQIGLQKGIIHQSELSVLESYLDFREKTAGDVMQPRIALQAVDSKAKMTDLLKMVSPQDEDFLVSVYREDIDHIIGYVDVRDILPFRYRLDERKSLLSILQPIHPVPETKNLMELLREMTAKQSEVAVVIDEYGGTAGAVTFHDLVTDFLQFFYPSDQKYRQLEENVYLFPGHFDLEKAGEILGTLFESDNRTVSGYVIEQLEEIPEVGKELKVDGFLFTVKSVAGRRVVEVEVRKKS